MAASPPGTTKPKRPKVAPPTPDPFIPHVIPSTEPSPISHPLPHLGIDFFISNRRFLAVLSLHLPGYADLLRVHEPPMPSWTTGVTKPEKDGIRESTRAAERMMRRKKPTTEELAKWPPPAPAADESYYRPHTTATISTHASIATTSTTSQPTTIFTDATPHRHPSPTSTISPVPIRIPTRMDQYRMVRQNIYQAHFIDHKKAPGTKYESLGSFRLKG
ncbi:hypothetical protein M422DRAFT_248245 [Sphaerobolus stellatus SS14]|uniref:Uncharacterized protein n=1 Tax=Sphaerobolus stellatus (strain SS14) TaxID=990650 RepID=A0A0C9VJB5_SPHS4|nr:hypothetical protein M422DRAFT_248245 [Sphaerobolus stellatus SS14]